MKKESDTFGGNKILLSIKNSNFKLLITIGYIIFSMIKYCLLTPSNCSQLSVEYLFELED